MELHLNKRLPYLVQLELTTGLRDNMNVLQIYHDFQKADEQGRLILSLLGTIRDLKENNIMLSEGLHLTFSDKGLDEKGMDDSLVAEGVVEYNRQINEWVAKIDWSKIKK